MTTRIADIATPNASRYLQQMCKHFGHKVAVEFDQSSGRIELPFGTCQLEASARKLTLNVTGPATDIRRTEQVIADHLARFAFREDPTITWRNAA